VQFSVIAFECHFQFALCSVDACLLHLCKPFS